MAPRVIARPSTRKPYKTYQALRLSDLIWVAKQQQFQDFQTIFRGQSQDLPLVPSIGRAVVPPGYGAVAVTTSGWYADPPQKGLPLLEARMLEEFRLMSPAYTDSLPADLWEVIAIAQHFGLPTRLLDWTTNPLIAVWFIVAEKPRPGQRPGVFWVHVPDEADFVDPVARARSPLECGDGTDERPKVFRSRFVTPRIRAQSGLFTVHRYSERHSAFRPMDKVGSHLGCMTKVLVPTTAFEEIRDDLELVGVNGGLVMPDLGGLARSIAARFLPWSTE